MLQIPNSCGGLSILQRLNVSRIAAISKPSLGIWMLPVQSLSHVQLPVLQDKWQENLQPLVRDL